MPGRKTETHRITIFCHGLGDDFFCRHPEGMRVVVDLCQATHNEAFQAVELAGAFQAVHHPVDVIDILVHLLDEQDLSILLREGVGTHHAIQHRKVAPNDFAFHHALAVQGMAGQLITQRLARQGIDKRLFGFGRLVGEIERHRSVKRRHTQAVQFSMKHGDVAEAYQPFGMLQKLREVQPINDADAAIAASGAPDGFDLFAVEILLKHGSTKIVAAGKDMVLGKKRVIIHRHETLLFQPFDGNGHFFAQHTPRRGCYDYF